jgi:hypothetical protein
MAPKYRGLNLPVIFVPFIPDYGSEWLHPMLPGGRGGKNPTPFPRKRAAVLLFGPYQWYLTVFGGNPSAIAAIRPAAQQLDGLSPDGHFSFAAGLEGVSALVILCIDRSQEPPTETIR